MGPGFYTTQDLEYSVMLAEWRSGPNVPYFINHYEYDDELAEKLHYKIKKFNLDEEWLQYLIDSYKGVSKRYDIVEGPTADDNVRILIEKYVDEYPNGDRRAFSELLEFLKIHVNTTQIHFQSQRAIDNCLKYTGADEYRDVRRRV